MWSAALCTLGVTKPIWGCTCLNFRNGLNNEESRGKRPLKIWDCERNIRKGIVVGSFDELLARGKDKLGISASENVRVVLELDGTQVEDGEYFRTLPNNTVLLLLRPGDRWSPSGADVIIAAIRAIPTIVCETIYALELHNETPSWKIMDNKGRITVVLHWDRPQGKRVLSAQSSFDKLQSGSSPRIYSPHITIINSEDQEKKLLQRRLTKQSSSIDSLLVHVHTPECAHHAHTPSSKAGSPTRTSCDFHCCTLHEDGRDIAVQKSVATSPIQGGVAGSSSSSGMGNLSGASPQPHCSNLTPSSSASGTLQRRQSGSKGHVRFMEPAPEQISSESDTENTTVDDDNVTSEKFLLLVDQLSLEQKKHLNIKDIGLILERLDNRIIDVEKLERDDETEDCHHWTIKATIRGEQLRELGVLYNNNYYAVSEHPGYKEENEAMVDEIDDDGDDRL